MNLRKALLVSALLAIAVWSVKGAPPEIVQFYVNLSGGSPGGGVPVVGYYRFDALDEDGVITHWRICFGDGDCITDGPNVSLLVNENGYHTYEQPGLKAATLVVYDDEGNSDSETVYVYPITESFVADGDYGLNSLAFCGGSFWARLGVDLVEISPGDGQILTSFPFPVGVTGETITSDGNFIWSGSDTAFHKIDPASGDVVDSLAVTIPENLQGMAFDGEFIWFSTCSSAQLNMIGKIDPATGEIVDWFRLDCFGYTSVGDLAWDGSSLWVSFGGGYDRSFAQLNPETGEVIATFDLGWDLSLLLFGRRGVCWVDDLLWVVHGGAGNSKRLDGINPDVWVNPQVNVEPNVCLQLPDPPVAAGESAMFSDCSTDIDGEIVDRCWKFGDGTVVFSDTLQYSHTYAAPGTYEITLEVCDSHGATDTTSQSLDVQLQLDTSAIFKVDEQGNVLADQAFFGTSFQSGAADVAEWVPVSEEVEPGDVLGLDPDNSGQYRKTRGACSDLVAGVVSTNPGFVLGYNPSTLDIGPWTDSDSALLALLGIVLVKVTDEGGPIQPGDLLVTSSTSGYAMRWDPDDGSPCNLVGKALESLTEESGIILALLTAH